MVPVEFRFRIRKVVYEIKSRECVFFACLSCRVLLTQWPDFISICRSFNCSRKITDYRTWWQKLSKDGDKVAHGSFLYFSLKTENHQCKTPRGYTTSNLETVYIIYKLPSTNFGDLIPCNSRIYRSNGPSSHGHARNRRWICPANKPFVTTKSTIICR